MRRGGASSSEQPASCNLSAALPLLASLCIVVAFLAIAAIVFSHLRGRSVTASTQLFRHHGKASCQISHLLQCQPSERVVCFSVSAFHLVFRRSRELAVGRLHSERSNVILLRSCDFLQILDCFCDGLEALEREAVNVSLRLVEFRVTCVFVLREVDRRIMLWWSWFQFFQEGD